MTDAAREERLSRMRETSVQVRKERLRKREEQEEVARLGVRAMMGQRLEAEADALTDRLRSLALSEDDSIALRGIELWLSRVYGRPVQPTEDRTEQAPSLPQDILALSPEERRTLLRLAETG